MKVTKRLKHAWNAFTKEPQQMYDRGQSSSRPMHRTMNAFNSKSFVSSIFNRIALDVAMTSFKHVKVNLENDDITDIKSGLNECLTTEANVDQTHIQFIHDLVYSMFDEGVVAVVPVETSVSPDVTGGYDIHSLRVGRVVNWFPKHVEIDVYNEETGQNERIFMAKRNVAIIENPLYAVINDRNSTLQRLIRKLNELDDIDNIAASGRLDLIISVPYGIKSETQKQMAQKRINDIENQLSLGRNGIAYIDATEKVTQLNRPANSQLPETIENLTQQLYNQLGLTKSIFDGTAKEAELRTYYTRSIDVIVEFVVAEFNRKFLTKTARTQGHRITYYRDMFKMVPAETIATLGDTFRRNYIATPNEIRKLVGFKHSNDPRADELFNPNIADNKQTPVTNGSVPVDKPLVPTEDEEVEEVAE